MSNLDVPVQEDVEALIRQALSRKLLKLQSYGSVERLRDERRDLYDLLYGDDDESPTADNVMANLPMGDDNLDSFDPYGLDDF
jgi:hypothetical protein